LVTKRSNAAEIPRLELTWSGPEFQNKDLAVYH